MKICYRWIISQCSNNILSVLPDVDISLFGKKFFPDFILVVKVESILIGENVLATKRCSAKWVQSFIIVFLCLALSQTNKIGWVQMSVSVWSENWKIDTKGKLCKCEWTKNDINSKKLSYIQINYSGSIDWGGDIHRKRYMSYSKMRPLHIHWLHILVHRGIFLYWHTFIFSIWMNAEQKNKWFTHKCSSTYL